MLAAPSSQPVSLRHLEVGYHLGVMSLLGATCLGEGNGGKGGRQRVKTRHFRPSADRTVEKLELLGFTWPFCKTGSKSVWKACKTNKNNGFIGSISISNSIKNTR